MEFGNRLKDWIKENGYTQSYVAAIAGVNKSYISNIISGRVPPSEKILNTLSKLSGHTVHWWLYGSEEYDNLYSLNELINFFIDNGNIKNDGSYDNDIKDILITMLNKEIKDKINKKEAQD